MGASIKYVHSKIANFGPPLPLCTHLYVFHWPPSPCVRTQNYRTLWMPPNPLSMCSRECSRDKLKTYLYQQNAYGHKTYQRSDITQGVPTHKFTYPLNEVVMWGHETNWICYISTCRRPLNTKLGKSLTYNERLPSLKSHDPLITWRTWGHVTFSKIYISTTLSQKLTYGQGLTYASRFRAQLLKSLATSCSMLSL